MNLPEGPRTFTVGSAGSVVVDIQGGRLSLAAVNPASGWSYEVDKAEPDDVRVEFEKGDSEAEIRVRLRAEPDGFAVVEVADTGPGLSPEQAERVFILSVEGGMVAGPSAEEAARYLTRSGVPAQAMHVPQNRGVGETSLEHAKALEVDLIIKGAYTQSRLRQMIFGGATSHILSMANVPVLLAH